MKLEKWIVKKKFRCTLTEKVLGTITKNKEIHSKFVAKRIQEKVNKGLLSQADADAMNLEEIDTVKDIAEAGVTGFYTDEKGMFVYDYYVRGFFKSAFKALGEILEVKNARSKIDMYVFVFPRKIYFQNNDGIITANDGVLERPLRAETMQGPRVTLAKSEFINEGAFLEFEVWLLPNKSSASSKKIDDDKIEVALEYGMLQGFGQFRNGGYGRFIAEELK